MLVLPQSISATFDGRDLATKVGVSALLSTVDAEGWPHLSFLSAGEVLVEGTTVALTLWGKARSAEAAERQGRAVLFAAADDMVWELRLALVHIVRDVEPTVVLVARVVEMREHRAPYAQVQTLIGFTLDDDVATVERWTAQMARMRMVIEEIGEAR